MSDPGFIPADICVDTGLPAEREELFVNAMTALGASVSVRVLPARRGAGDVQWLILAALPLQAFLSGIGSKIADDVYQAFQKTVRKLLRAEEADKPEARPIILQDSASGIQVVLDRDLPAEGYEQLLSLDLARFHFGPVHYDLVQRRWRSELDEA